MLFLLRSSDVAAAEKKNHPFVYIESISVFICSICVLCYRNTAVNCLCPVDIGAYSSR